MCEIRWIPYAVRLRDDNDTAKNMNNEHIRFDDAQKH